MTWEEADRLFPGCSIDFDVALSQEDHPHARQVDTLVVSSNNFLCVKSAKFQGWWLQPMWILLPVEHPELGDIWEWRFHLGAKSTTAGWTPW